MAKQWKPRPAELAAIRAYAAKHERKAPRSIILEPGERCALVESVDRRSINVLLVDPSPDWNESDLFTTHAWGTLRRGVDLTDDGRALVDLYVYERRFGEHGDLLTNVQAHVETIDGRARLVALTGTLTPREEILADA